MFFSVKRYYLKEIPLTAKGWQQKADSKRFDDSYMWEEERVLAFFAIVVLDVSKIRDSINISNARAAY